GQLPGTALGRLRRRAVARQRRAAGVRRAVDIPLGRKTNVSSPQLRRQDRILENAEARELIARAYCGRVGTVGSDGWPYVVPLLHVFSGDVISLHNTAERGHFRLNVERSDARACFEVDEPVQVFDYGRFECDSGLAYRSAIAYGRIRIVDERAAKTRFFDE